MSADRPTVWAAYGQAAAVVALATVVAWLLVPFADLPNLIMV